MPHARSAPVDARRAARAACWLGALAGNAAAAAAFLALPWAEGRGLLAGRVFDGPGLARLLRNTDLLLGGWSGGPVAAVLVLALFAAPVAALAALVLAAGAPLAHHPARALAAAAVLSVVSAAAAGVLAGVVWLNGQAAADPLVAAPAGGLAAAVLAVLAAAGAGIAGRMAAGAAGHATP